MLPMKFEIQRRYLKEKRHKLRFQIKSIFWEIVFVEFDKIQIWKIMILTIVLLRLN